jgi:hypothetical protein
MIIVVEAGVAGIIISGSRACGSVVAQLGGLRCATRADGVESRAVEQVSRRAGGAGDLLFIIYYFAQQVGPS